MSKKSRGGGGGAAAGEDPEDLSRSPLQAVLLADSFTLKFRPITLERPKVPSNPTSGGHLRPLPSPRARALEFIPLPRRCCCRW